MVTVENRVRSSVTPFVLEDFANLVFGFCLFVFVWDVKIKTLRRNDSFNQ